MSLGLAYQPELFAEEIDLVDAHARFTDRSGAFGDNMSLPVHRWYRYSAGFSADWVRLLLREKNRSGSGFAVLDPFAGVATTLIASEAERLQSRGFEAHPFISRVAQAKINGLRVDSSVLHRLFNRFLVDLTSDKFELPTNLPPLLERCYTIESLKALWTMRELFIAEYNDGSYEAELLWLVITSILRPCSGAGTAQWQYVLPNKSKSNVKSPLEAFKDKAAEILQDIEYAQRGAWGQQATLLVTDARQPQGVEACQFDAVITSPPYPNNYDYADATRLEMTFWGEVEGWGDLQSAVRKHLIRSCSQHAAAEKLELDSLLSEPILQPIREPLGAACQTLTEIRLTKGGRKNYHTMAAAYFRDLGMVLQALRPLCREGGFLCLVIGDSAPYGVYLHVEEWLGQLAQAVGFKSYSFEKIRDRNVKWKNRKHRVPLKEGRLWIEA